MAELAKVAASSEVDLEDLAAKSADVQRLITSKDPVKALARALENPPTASKDAAVKCAAAEVVFRALEANADIGKLNGVQRRRKFLALKDAVL